MSAPTGPIPRSEWELKLAEFELSQQQFVVSRIDSKANRRSFTWAAISVVLTALVGIATVVLTTQDTKSQIAASNNQLRQTLNDNDAQFRAQTRASYYNSIVDGLGSSSAGVQAGSLYLLTNYVQDPTNYSSVTDQQTGAFNAIQTLTAFIDDKSADAVGTVGLDNYDTPQPVILSRAMDQIKILDQNAALGTHTVDVGGANFHGISLPYFTPLGNLLGAASDFRQANLTGLDLRKGGEDSLTGAFFTCADLKNAMFGKAIVTSSDFSGANLDGADLASAVGLTSAQLAGASTDINTHLPAGVTRPPGAAWGYGSSKCAQVVDRMTGMLAGQGYASGIPCPLDSEDASGAEVPAQDGPDLYFVCDARKGI